MFDRCQQESQAGRRSGRVFNHQQPVVLGFRQVFERHRDRQVVSRKISLVVIDTNIAVIHRQGSVLRIKFEFSRNLRQERRGIRHIDTCIQGAREEGVIHAIEYICQGSILGENGLVERRPGITAFQENHLDIIGLFKSGDHRFAGGKGVMRHYRQV